MNDKTAKEWAEKMEDGWQMFLGVNVFALYVGCFVGFLYTTDPLYLLPITGLIIAATQE